MSSGMDLIVAGKDREFRETACQALETRGHRVRTANTEGRALSLLREGPVDVVVLDLDLLGDDGTDAWRRLREVSPGLECVLVTAPERLDRALEQVKRGAYGYLTWPLELPALVLLAEEAYEKKRTSLDSDILESDLIRRTACRKLVGTSEALARVIQRIERVARASTPVLIEGPTGVGKELVAEAIHAASPRRLNAFVPVNCGAFQSTLLESEFFGHEKGAFTGATARKPGLLEIADGGILFIDELEEMDRSLQVKLLRVLEGGLFRRVGATREQTVDVRILCASNRVLEEEVRAGRFREDLFYRLNVLRIEVPPLRERKEDIPLLARHFLLRAATLHQREGLQLSQGALDVLIGYAWPGNIRELANVIEHAAVFCDGTTIGPDDLPRSLMLSQSGERAPSSPHPTPFGVSPGWGSAESGSDLTGASRPTLAEIERDYILETMEAMGGNQTRAARVLGVSLRNLSRKLAAYGYRRPRASR